MTASADDAAACFKLAQKQSNFVKLNFIQFHESEFGNTCYAYTIDPAPTMNSSWKASPQMTTYYRDPVMRIVIIVASVIAGVVALVVALIIIYAVIVKIVVNHRRRTALDSGQASMDAPLLVNAQDPHVASSPEVRCCCAPIDTRSPSLTNPLPPPSLSLSLSGGGCSVVAERTAGPAAPHQSR